MKLLYIFGVFAVITFSNSAHIPAVYEDAQKQAEKHNPTIFNFQEYQKVSQQNPQIVRYQQQQEADKQHKHRQARFSYSIVLDQNEASTQESSVKVPTESSWKVMHPKFVTEIQKDNLPLISIRNQDNQKAKIDNTHSHPNNKDMTQSSQKEDRQDIGNDFFLVNSNDIALVKPINLQQNSREFPLIANQDSHIVALNSLIGQTPTLQLQGLQQLLNPISKKDHVPIKENVIDIPNTQSKPNIKVQHSPNTIRDGIQTLSDQKPDKIKTLQAQLDATANAHAESIIAQAQQKALEHVKAQHEAIARVQIEAEEKALAEIEAQNRELSRIHALAEAERLAHIQRGIHAQKLSETKTNEKNREIVAFKEGLAHRAVQDTKLLADKEYVKKVSIDEEKRLSEISRQDKSREYAKGEILDDVASIAQKTRLHSQTYRKQQQTIQQQPSEPQEYYSQVPNDQQPRFEALTHPQPFHSQSAYHPQTNDLPETKGIYQRIEPTSNIHKSTHLELPQSHRYQHLNSHRALEYTSYGKGNEQQAEVNKYYISPQIIVHQGKNIHGENELQYAAKYEFGYRIRDHEHGNDFGHRETKDGDITKGHYHVLLPDGRVQNVHYYVDPSGYHAKVSYASSADH